MAALAVALLRALKRLCRVALFLSQLYVLSGRGSLSLEHHPHAQLPKVSAMEPASTQVPASKVPGNRNFPKMLYCNWTGGYKWSTALALSITLGGFGADRFYLGQWREGLGKLFSFGGLGIWTLIDVLLIGVGYVGPADGSLYI
uniref:TM2 domain-containing protein 3 n=1 Tax=Anolis carolinensis TaxID=28377 RepID=A0A803T7Z9_ANOCA